MRLIVRAASQVQIGGVDFGVESRVLYCESLFEATLEAEWMEVLMVCRLTSCRLRSD